MTEKTILMRLDDFARWPMIKIFGDNGDKRLTRRPLRWTSTIVLALALMGFIALLVSPAHLVLGYIFLALVTSLGAYVRTLRPVKP